MTVMVIEGDLKKYFDLQELLLTPFDSTDDKR